MTKRSHSNEEFAELGEAVFDGQIAERLRGRDLRDFVAIEVGSGDYEVDPDEGLAMRRLRGRHPGAVFWIRRVGSAVSHTFGPRLTLEPPWVPGVSRAVEVQVSDSVSLLGMALLAGHQVRIDVEEGRAVSISPLTQLLS